MLAEKLDRALAGLQGKAFGHQKMALESTLRLHNDGAARRVSAGIESGPHAQSGFLQADLLARPSRVQDVQESPVLVIVE
jgi:hypothetical protein